MTTLDVQTSRGVAELARVVELQQINTVEIGAKLLAQPPPISEQIHLDLNANVEVATPNDGFVVQGTFDVKASGAEKTVFLELRFKVIALYRVPSPLPDRTVLEGFGKTNALIHLWPYFRAFVQQTCGQLSIPPIVIQPFRIRPTEGGTSETPAGGSKGTVGNQK